MRVVPLLTLALATFALGFGELMIAGVLPAIAADVDASIPLTGQLVTIYALTFAVLSPPLAIAFRTAGPKRLLIVSLLVVAAANGFAAVAPTFLLLAIARVIAAAGSAVATPLALAAIDRVTTEGVRGRAHGIVFTGFSLAALLGVPLGALIAAQFGWRWTFASVAFFAVCAAVGTACTIPAGTASDALTVRALLRTLGRPALRQTLIVSTLFLTALYTAFTYFRPYFAHANGDGIVQIAWLFSLYGGFGIVGTLLAGIAIDRWGTRPVLLIAIGGSATALAAMPILSRSLLGSSAAVAVWAVTSWGFGPAANRQLDRDAGDARDVALALNLTAFNVGIASGSVLGAGAIIVSGLGSIPLAAAALCVFAFAAAAPFRAPTADRLPR